MQLVLRFPWNSHKPCSTSLVDRVDYSSRTIDGRIELLLLKTYVRLTSPLKRTSTFYVRFLDLNYRCIVAHLAYRGASRHSQPSDHHRELTSCPIMICFSMSPRVSFATM